MQFPKQGNGQSKCSMQAATFFPRLSVSTYDSIPWESCHMTSNATQAQAETDRGGLTNIHDADRYLKHLKELCMIPSCGFSCCSGIPNIFGLISTEMKAHLGPRFWVKNPWPTKAPSPSCTLIRSLRLDMALISQVILLLRSQTPTRPMSPMSAFGSKCATESQTIMHLVMTTRRGSSCSREAPTVCQKTRNTFQESCNHNYINEITVYAIIETVGTQTLKRKNIITSSWRAAPTKIRLLVYRQSRHKPENQEAVAIW